MFHSRSHIFSISMLFISFATIFFLILYGKIIILTYSCIFWRSCNQFSMKSSSFILEIIPSIKRKLLLISNYFPIQRWRIQYWKQFDYKLLIRMHQWEWWCEYYFGFNYLKQIEKLPKTIISSDLMHWLRWRSCMVIHV